MEQTPILPGQRKVSLDQAFQLAAEHHAAGRTEPAEHLLRQVTDKNPRHAGAWQLRAIIAHEAGNTPAAIDMLGQAIKANPLVSLFYSNRAEMHRLLGNNELALADAEQAARLEPNSPIAQGNLGIVLYHLGRLDEAEAAQRKALKSDPRHVQALNNLGSILRDRRDRAGAVEMYRRALAVQPGYAESANNLGAVLTEMENPEEGLKVLLGVLKNHPRYPEAHSNIGLAFLALENAPKAEAAFRNALALRPDHADAHEGLARALQEQRNLAGAEESVRAALRLRPGRASTLSLLGNIQSEKGFPDEAAESFRQALAIDPKCVAALLGLGHLEMEMGRMDVAEQCFSQALALDPASIAPRLSLTQVRKTKPDDENFLALQEAAKDIGNMPETRAMSLHFSLGKALDDLKRYDEAFPHFLEGCRLKRKRVNYSVEGNSLLVENIRRSFTPERIASLRGEGCPSATPILVLGMPRSGTTLTETIIASHPDVYGAGELPDLLKIAGGGPRGNDVGYPLNIAQATPADLARMGQQYVDQLQARKPDARRITDKMPANYLAVGLVHLMLPNAKIVHIKRNAVDTCLSQFTRLFNRSQYQSYELRELGRHYLDYLKVMAHWREVLPPGSFYEIQYEQLVANQEEESRKLIAYCGLEWNDACLTPDKTERNVKTASVTQVRQPVYTSSVERWRVYEKFLGPLLEELGDAARG